MSVYPLQTKNSLFPHQKDAVNWMSRIENQERVHRMQPCGGILAHAMGLGKCLAKGTPVLMWDGTVRAVDTVRVGDLLCGDDSTSRTVLSLAHGRETMYSVQSKDGQCRYVCNQSHILSFRVNTSHLSELEQSCVWSDLNRDVANVVDVPIKEYLELRDSVKYCLKGFRVPVDWPTARFDGNPYTVGVSLGRKNIDSLPLSLKRTSSDIRDMVLSGVLSTFVQKDVFMFEGEGFFPTALNTILFLVRSLGYYARTTCQGGLLIVCEYKKPREYNVVVEELGVDEYYGVCIGRNHRFLLGDFTVTHNTRSMLTLKEVSAPALTIVICPKSVLSHWSSEARACTSLAEENITIYHGSGRNQNMKLVAPHLLLTTFDIARVEFSRSNEQSNTLLFQTVWDRVIVDEAHRICEQGSKTSKSMHALIGRNRWCVTGTPYKNDLSDLVSLCKFLKIDPYARSGWWRRNAQNQRSLNTWRSRYVHIREKDETMMPDITTLNVSCCMEPFEDELQKNIRWSTIDSFLDQRPDESEEDQTIKYRNQEFELLKILRMRQAAIHPFLLAPLDAVRWLCKHGPCETPGCCSACGIAIDHQKHVKVTPLPIAISVQDLPPNLSAVVRDINVTDAPKISCNKHDLCMACSAQTVACPACVAETMPRMNGWVHSTKTSHLMAILDRHILRPKEKCILFSQWTSCLDLLEIMFDASNINYCRFDGSINGIDERQEAVADFAARDKARVMLTSLGAGGEGIDLTCATVVILMEPYWNHAIEQQAVDRIHRLGQSKPVKVFKLHLNKSVEDWVLQLQKCKIVEQKYYLSGVVPEAQNEEEVMHAIPSHARQNGTLKKLIKRHEKLAPSVQPKTSWRSMVDLSQCKKQTKKRSHSAISSTLDIFVHAQ